MRQRLSEDGAGSAGPWLSAAADSLGETGQSLLLGPWLVPDVAPLGTSRTFTCS